MKKKASQIREAFFLFGYVNLTVLDIETSLGIRDALTAEFVLQK